MRSCWMHLAFAAVVAARSSSSNCTNPAVRIEWSSLDSSEQIAYLDAERCLWDLSAETHLSNVTNRYTDLVAVHQSLTDYVHGDGVFLPWHRYYVHTHETLLRKHCTTLARSHTWWDERKDSGAFSNASIFSPSTFSSISGTPYNGIFADQKQSHYVCVTDGYFAKTTLHIGFGMEETNHCLSRAVNENQSNTTSDHYVEMCNSYGNYTKMFKCAFQYPHGGGHGGVGGVMGDVFKSPGDPVFFLHHDFIDRNWWAWQSADPDNRLYQLSGYTTESEPSTGWVDVTLDYNLTSYKNPDATIEQVMDTEGGYLCYTYEY
ncbi:hypothetical protein ABZX51_007407 [Aspergillus tubingensis]